MSEKLEAPIDPHVARIAVWLSAAFLAVIMISVGVYFASINPRLGHERNEATVKQNLLDLQLAIEQYARSKEDYPRTLDVLKKPTESVEYTFPINPFSGHPMSAVRFGHYPIEGKFTYIHIAAGNYGGTEFPYSTYYLMAYGSDRTDGMDVNEDGTPDHVFLVLSSGISCVSDDRRLDHYPPISLREALARPAE